MSKVMHLQLCLLLLLERIFNSTSRILSFRGQKLHVRANRPAYKGDYLYPFTWSYTIPTFEVGYAS